MSGLDELEDGGTNQKSKNIDLFSGPTLTNGMQKKSSMQSSPIEKLRSQRR